MSLADPTTPAGILETLKRKRAHRRGLVTRVQKKLQAFRELTIEDIPRRKLDALITDLDREVKEHDQLQDQIDGMVATDADALQAEQVERDHREETHATLRDTITELIERKTIWMEGNSLKLELEQLQAITEPYRDSHRNEVKTFKASTRNFITRAASFMDDECIHGLAALVKDGATTLASEMSRTDVPTPTSSPSTTTSPTPTAKAAPLTVALPKFDGDPTHWRHFESLFTTALKTRACGFSNYDQRALLLDAITTAEGKEVIRNFPVDDAPVSDILDCLRMRFGSPQVVIPHIMKKITAPATFAHTYEGLSSLRGQIIQNTQALKPYIGDSLSAFMLYYAKASFTTELRKEWDTYTSDKLSSPDLGDLSTFVNTRCLHMAPSNAYNSAPSSSQPSSQPSPFPKRSPPKGCVVCSESHGLLRCKTFASFDIDKRNKLVREKRLCVNCFSDQHGCKHCPSKFSCQTCEGRHHTMLHKDRSQPPAATPPTSGSSAGSFSVKPANLSEVPSGSSFPNTVTVTLSNGSRDVTARAILDSGSALSMMSEKLATSLGLKRIHRPMSLSGVGPVDVHTKYCVITSLFSHCRSFESPPLTFTVLPRLKSAPVPRNREEILRHPTLRNLPLADPELGGEVDLLLGNLDLVHFLQDATLKIEGMRILPTHFGWSIAGPLPGNVSAPSMLATAAPDDLQTNLEKLWTLDQVPESSAHSQDDDEIIRDFETSYSRDQGRFVVKLPHKKDPPALGDSRRQAYKRLLSNEKSLSAKDKLSAFNDVLREYLQLGHAHKIPRDELHLSPHFYLPVHGVFKESSSTTKVRAVFDASARSTSGSSLNDTLMPGPNLYPLLPDVLLRFRRHSIGMTADISKMFREILLNPSERDLHRFLLRDVDGAIVDGRMSRLTFGVNCSPFLATQVLHTLARLHSESHPLASDAILRSFYVDDFLSGADSVDEADKLRKELCDLLSGAGMTLRKWRTNSKPLQDRIPPELLESCPLTLPTPSQSPKALGVHWDVNRDTLHISTPTPPSTSDSDSITKRVIASGTAGVFDILGLFAPAIIPARILLQESWKLSLSWDEPVPADMSDKWNQWTSNLHYITEFSIPRRLSPSSEPTIFVALHGFCDASKYAYGAAVYLRSVVTSRETLVSLVIAKARVLPVKPVTIPKAELLGAHLLAKLLDSTRRSLDIDIENTFAWTDSSIVLQWLPKSTSSLERFVANRVAAIRQLIPSKFWKHIRSQDNPADLASRGIPAPDLVNSKLWWNGPPWLSLPPAEWPVPLVPTPAVTANCHLVQISSPSESYTSPLLSHLLSKFSNFHHLNRIFAWIYRFISNIDPDLKEEFRPPLLTSEEIQNAKEILFRFAQKKAFPEIFTCLKKKIGLPNGHPLARAIISISKNGHLLVSSRVRSQSSPSRPNQLVLLSAKSQLTKVLIRSLHSTYGHAGIAALHSILGCTYYIPGLRNLLKAISRSCPQCQRAQAKPLSPQMGMLPSYCTTPAPPFSTTGVDFAGPFLIRQGHTRKPVYIKTYAVVFVCLCTKAVHLDLCSSLSTPDFIACLRRFIARRGCPSLIMSDNGTNFVGAREEIRELQRLTESKETREAVSHLAAENGINWKHIPPRAPHFGGLWKAGVKAMKTLLRKNLKPHALRHEELYTLLTEVEATLNSRQLAPLQADDISEGLYLTAGHFLVNRPLKAAPTPEPTREKVSSLKRWNLVNRLTSDLWEQWLGSYLASCSQRSKWHRRGRRLKPGDLVFIKDETLRLRDWPLAIITEIHPGDDGEVRAVHLRCRGHTYLRPSHMLIPFTPDEDSTEDPNSSPPGRMSGTPPRQ